MVLNQSHLNQVPPEPAARIRADPIPFAQYIYHRALRAGEKYTKSELTIVQQHACPHQTHIDDHGESLIVYTRKDSTLLASSTQDNTDLGSKRTQSHCIVQMDLWPGGRWHPKDSLNGHPVDYLKRHSFGYNSPISSTHPLTAEYSVSTHKSIYPAPQKNILTHLNFIMVSLSNLITLLSVFVAVSRAADITAAKNQDVDAKWFGFDGMLGWNTWSGFDLDFMGTPWLNSWAGLLPSCAGGLVFPSVWGMNGFFAKASEEARSVSRRAINLDAEQLFRRDQLQADSASCLNDKGVYELYSKSDCKKAAKMLHEKDVHTASSGNCQLSLYNANEKVFAKQLPDQMLVKAADRILSTCGQKASQPKGSQQSRVEDNQVAMLLSRPSK
ncbi:hypothetical protein PGT21_030638 [Puccinia graminis f. sp. tritici]|uniref:Uncharacterized protein n=1 Tax=Puccinia graminis f. sp. tritici TaxID=56615 RepID=A0A5B0MVW9_PUCGR|nr:hypothetical protein PGT21_030638 [Puccinia graminis f. sp. tritici]